MVTLLQVKRHSGSKCQRSGDLKGAEAELRNKRLCIACFGLDLQWNLCAHARTLLALSHL